MKCKIRYVHMGAFPIYVGFTTSPTLYLHEMRRLNVKKPPPFVSPGADATTHTLENPKSDKVTCIICLDRESATKRKISSIQIAAMLAHEAVHVKQKLMANINEVDPSAEFEAYTVQWVMQFCCSQYAKGH